MVTAYCTQGDIPAEGGTASNFFLSDIEHETAFYESTDSPDSEKTKALKFRKGQGQQLPTTSKYRFEITWLV